MNGRARFALLGAGMAFALTACNGGGTTSPTPPSSTAAPVVTPAPGATLFQPVALTTSSFSLATIGSGGAKTATITQLGFSGTYTLSGLAGCANIVTPTVSGSTLTVTAVGVGTCTFSVVGYGASATVSATVINPATVTIGIPGVPVVTFGSPAPVPTPLPAPVASPGAVSVATGATASVAVSEKGYSGTYFASLADPSIATLNANALTSGAFAVTGRIPGTTTLFVSDGASTVTPVVVTVTLGVPTLSSKDNPNSPIMTTATTPFAVPRGQSGQVQLNFPAYPGSSTTVLPPSVVPIGCATAVDSGASSTRIAEIYTLTALTTSPANCAVALTFSETTLGQTASVTLYILVQ